MKRLLLFFMVIFSLLGFSSCDKNNEIAYGSFYSLDTLYENKVLDNSDLLNIAYWNNQGNVIDKDGKKMAININDIKLFDELDKNVSSMIINDFYLKIKDDRCFNNHPLDIKDLKLHSYCGIYNEYIAFRMYYIQNYKTKRDNEIIGNFTYIYPLDSSSNIMLWKLNDK